MVSSAFADATSTADKVVKPATRNTQVEQVNFSAKQIKAQEIAAIRVGVKDIRERKFPEDIVEFYAKGLSAKTNSAIYIYFNNGTHSETGNDKIVCWIDGSRSFVYNTVTPGHGAITSGVRDDTIEQWVSYRMLTGRSP